MGGASSAPCGRSFSETGLENSREIGRFFREFVPENPAKFDFFFATYQKPCMYELWQNDESLVA